MMITFIYAETSLAEGWHYIKRDEALAFAPWWTHQDIYKLLKGTSRPPEIDILTGDVFVYPEHGLTWKDQFAFVRLLRTYGEPDVEQVTIVTTSPAILSSARATDTIISVGPSTAPTAGDKHDAMIDLDAVFVLTPTHIRLLHRMSVGWHDTCAFGAPAIRCHRPYGNSAVLLDIAEAADLFFPDDDVTPTSYAYLQTLHHAMQDALQVVLHTGSFVPGVYWRQASTLRFVRIASLEECAKLCIERLSETALQMKMATPIPWTMRLQQHCGETRDQDIYEVIAFIVHGQRVSLLEIDMLIGTIVPARTAFAALLAAAIQCHTTQEQYGVDPLHSYRS